MGLGGGTKGIMAWKPGGRLCCTVHGWSPFRVPGAGGSEEALASAPTLTGGSEAARILALAPTLTTTACCAGAEEARAAAPGTGSAEGAAAVAPGTGPTEGAAAGAAAAAGRAGAAAAAGAGSLEDEEAPGTGPFCAAS